MAGLPGVGAPPFDGALRSALDRERFALTVLRAENAALRRQLARAIVSLELARGETQGLRAQLEHFAERLADASEEPDEFAAARDGARVLLERGRQAVARLRADGGGDGVPPGAARLPADGGDGVPPGFGG